MGTHEQKLNNTTARTSFGNTVQEEVKHFLCLMRQRTMGNSGWGT